MTTRTYDSGDLRVLWDSSRCIHVAECIRALPRVFNPLARPWVRMDAADSASIIEAVERCPTGALRYLRRDGVTETPASPATIEAIPNGPLLLRGDLQLMNGDGVPIAHETRVALCRCGASENKPFCDNAHRRIGFTTEDAIASPPPPQRGTARTSRDAAESPDDLGPEQASAFRRS